MPAWFNRNTTVQRQTHTLYVLSTAGESRREEYSSSCLTEDEEEKKEDLVADSARDRGERGGLMLPLLLLLLP
jgi:hypothetical protein